jgi:hypothetical protein
MKKEKQDDVPRTGGGTAPPPSPKNEDGTLS